MNTIDVEAANQRGIYVTNCPGKNSAAVAELAIGLLIACDRRIVNATNDLRGGQWRKKRQGAWSAGPDARYHRCRHDRQGSDPSRAWTGDAESWPGAAA